MKKYQKPQCSALELQLEQIIALSTTDKKGGTQLAPSNDGWNSEDWDSTEGEE